MGQETLTLIIRTLGDFYVFIVMMRFVLQVSKADFYNPISQAIAALTNAPLAPLRRLIPRIGGLDLSALVLALIVKMAALFLLLVVNGQSPNPIGVLIIGLVGLASITLDIYFYAVIGSVIISWIAPNSHHPAPLLIGQMTEPLFRVARKVVPPIGGLDLSPILIFLVIQVVQLQLHRIIS